MVQFLIALFLSLFFFGITYGITHSLVASFAAAVFSGFFAFLGLCLAAASHRAEERDISSEPIHPHQVKTRPVRLAGSNENNPASANK
jgi:hypothetical protein